MDARVASGLFVALGIADLAVLNLQLAPRLAAEDAARAAALSRPVPAPTPARPAALPAASAVEAAPIAAAPAAPPAPAPVSDVLFGLQAESVTSLDALLSLARVAAELRADPARRVLLRGHADKLGTPRHNLALSRARAESVRRLLLMRGVAVDRIDIEAVGDGDPADPASTPAAWARNRRVQILWR